MLQIFEIQLKNFTNNVYFAGEDLTGEIFLIINEPLQVGNGLKLYITGRARTEWTESRSVCSTNISGQIVSSKSLGLFKDEEVFIQYAATLWHRDTRFGPSNEPATLQPGSYSFPFTYSIPSNCPSSFEGSKGSIRYSCKAEAGENGLNFFTCKQPFTVVNVVDLNKDSNAQLPIKDTETKQIRSHVFGSTGKVECKVDLARCGYVPGEYIKLALTVDNNSSSTIDEVGVEFKEVVIYKAKNPDRKSSQCSTRLISKLSHGMIKPKDSLVWKNQGLLVPPLPPSLQNCRLIQSNYELHFKVFRRGSAIIKLCYPILIGTVPLSMSLKDVEKVIKVEPALPSPNHYKEVPVHTSSYTVAKDFPQPNYEIGFFLREAALKETAEKKHYQKSQKYTPRYPYFDCLSKHYH